MKKLSEYRNEEAVELLADLIEPLAEIFQDVEVRTAFASGNAKAAVKPILKNHAEAIVGVLAAVEGIDREEYECNVFTLPMKLVELINDPDFKQLFQSAELDGGATSSGSASENTTAI